MAFSTIFCAIASLSEAQEATPVLPLPTPTTKNIGEDLSQSTGDATPAVAEAPPPTPAADLKEPPKLLDGPRAYDSLTAKDGTVYQNCKVIRAEPSALLVRHLSGIARLSFFDLPESVQKEWGFDPFAAMEHYKTENERERALRWKLFWERQEYESEQEKIAAQERLREKAEREWIPVEGTVISRIEGGAAIVAHCKRIAFQKTKTKSTLGFEIDGPPKRVLVPFTNQAVILRIAVPSDSAPPVGGKWRGYLNPIKEGVGAYRFEGSEIPADIYSAVPLTDR